MGDYPFLPMTFATLIKKLFFWTLALLISLYLADYGDLVISDQLYDFVKQQWILSRDDFYWRLIAYKLPKWILAFVGISALGIWAIGFFKKKWQPYQGQAIFLTLCIAIVPSIIALSKLYTNRHCPSALHHYGGKEPYVKIFAPSSDKLYSKRGCCFPAGHASGGFALMGLYYTKRQRRWWLLLPGLMLGSAMGAYQMLWGSHFFSDTLATLIGAWMIILLLFYMIFPAQHKGIQ